MLKKTVYFRVLSKLRAKTTGYPQIQGLKIQLREKKVEMNIHTESILKVTKCDGVKKTGEIAFNFKIELLHFLTTQTEL